MSEKFENNILANCFIYLTLYSVAIQARNNSTKNVLEPTLSILCHNRTLFRLIFLFLFCVSLT